MNLKINYKDYEFLEMILKDNNIFIINKKTFFQFYSYFYQSFLLKKKEIEIKIGEKYLDSKNTILLSFCDYTEILNSLELKKGSLLYEYLVSCLYSNEFLDQDMIFYDLANIIQDVIKKSELNINYEINEDLEKILFTFTDFKLNYKFEELSFILNKILLDFIEKNQNKIFIIFFDSNILSLNLKNIDYCYSFDKI